MNGFSFSHYFGKLRWNDNLLFPEGVSFCSYIRLLRLLDQRYRGVAIGVGQSEILGRIHVAPLKVGFFVDFSWPFLLRILIFCRYLGNWLVICQPSCLQYYHIINTIFLLNWLIWYYKFTYLDTFIWWCVIFNFMITLVIVVNTSGTCL